jgi:cytochrome c oxidase cbb3-type subunit 3/ubiquinol-cytochrome c reductase cytochrome c subunit
MPPFGKAAGGMLTDRQIAIISQGMIQNWGSANTLAGFTPPAYASSAPGNPPQGQKAFAIYCAQCHGADGTGGTSPSRQPAGSSVPPALRAAPVRTGSLVDPAYLALISDQGLRSIILAGQTEQGAHDWRSYIPGHPMNDQEITDTVAWLASHRSQTPGQVYQQHP